MAKGPLGVRFYRSSVKGRRPQPADMAYGDVAVNYHHDDPALIIKGDDNILIEFKPGSGVTVSSTAPATAKDGDLWWDPVSARLFLRFTSGTPPVAAWVDASPAAVPPALANALTYKGTIDPTVALPSTVSPSIGDTYVANKAGTVHSSWTGLAGSNVSLHELLVWDGTEWDGAGVAASPRTAWQGLMDLTVAWPAPYQPAAGDVIEVSKDGTRNANWSSVPATAKVGSVLIFDGIFWKELTVGDATAAAKGVVQLADAAAITAGTANRVVDAAQLKADKVWTRSGSGATGVLKPTVATDGIDVPHYAVGGTAGADYIETVNDPFGGSINKTWSKGILIAAKRIAGISYGFDTEATAKGGTSGSINYVGQKPATVDWGDGQTEILAAGSAATRSHTYAAPGTYTITITYEVKTGNETGMPILSGSSVTSIHGTSPYYRLPPAIDRICMNNADLRGIGPVNMTGVTSMDSAFQGCHFPVFPWMDLSKVTTAVQAWAGNPKLTTMPTLDLGSCKNLNRAWYQCGALSVFPWMDTHNVTNVQSAWDGCGALGSFPELDLSRVTTAKEAWKAAGIKDFPALKIGSCVDFTNAFIYSSTATWGVMDVSKGQNFTGTWMYCPGLTTFPALKFTSATNFEGAWCYWNKMTTFPAGCFDVTGALVPNAFKNAFPDLSLTAASIENILVSLDKGGHHGVTLGFIMNGANPAIVGESAWTAAAKAAKASLVGKGWTITNKA